MIKPKIIVHSLVCNEEYYVWYSIMSVVDFVDEVLVWDSGSSDKTKEIIKEIIRLKGSKVTFKEVGSVSKIEYPNIRQKMLNESRGDWLLILDGDEVWPEDAIQKLVTLIRKEGGYLDSIVSPYFNIIGDIYHFQEEFAGLYKIGDKEGHLSIRAINLKIPGLHVDKPYGEEGYYDGDGVLVQQRTEKRRKFLDAPYLHFTHMRRSSKPRDWQKKKYKIELGEKFVKDFKFPGVFYMDRPSMVPPVWGQMSLNKRLVAAIITPLRKIKRRAKQLS